MFILAVARNVHGFPAKYPDQKMTGRGADLMLLTLDLNAFFGHEEHKGYTIDNPAAFRRPVR
ncbi:hypothetical protein SBDP1_110029 [Syntrophobacter sp. SbD1]|nr:hypothetical protein SBDP1_110029 [Syntrophobacter sp. SbD1]